MTNLNVAIIFALTNHEDVMGITIVKIDQMKSIVQRSLVHLINSLVVMAVVFQHIVVVTVAMIVMMEAMKLIALVSLIFNISIILKLN